MTLFFLITFYLSFVAFALSFVINIKIPGSIILLLVALVAYVSLVLTHSIYLTQIVVYGFVFLLFILSFVIILKYRKQLHKNYFIKHLKMEIICILFGVLLFVFANEYISEFVSLLPVSGVSERLALLQNVYFDTNIISINRNIDALTIVFSFIFKLVNALNEFDLVISYLSLVNLLFIYSLIEVLGLLWVENIDNNQLLTNCGLIIFFSLTYSFAFLKFGVLTYLWAIFPITFILYVLKSNLKLSFKIILSLILSFTIFCLGIDFSFSCFIALILFFVSVLRFIEYFLQKKANNFLFFIFFAGFILSWIYFFIKIQNNLQFDGYLKTNITCVFIPYFDPVIPTWIIIVIIAVLFIGSILSNKFSSSNVFLYILILIISNPFLLMHLFKFNNYQIILYFIFNPIILMELFNCIPKVYTNKCIVFVVCACGVVISNKFIVNPYYEENNALFNMRLRIPKEEELIYERISSTRSSITLKVISQAPYTSAFVPGAILHENYATMATRCQYCDVEALDLHEPSDLINCYQYREFPSNRIFIESPKYQNLKEITFEFNPDYLVIKNDQTIEVNGNWTKLSEYLANFYKVELITDNYTLLLK